MISENMKEIAADNQINCLIKSNYSRKNPVLKFMFKHYFSKIVKIVNDLNISTVLDVGCGEGLVIKKLKENNDKLSITGLDISIENIKIAKKINDNVKFFQGNIYNLPFEDNSFELIICTEVLEHLKDPERAIMELKRVSNKFCLISVPNEPFFRIGNILKLSYLKDLGNSPGHIQSWNSYSFENLLKNHFSNVKIDTSLLVWSFALCNEKII